jgi:hypothetical protein
MNTDPLTGQALPPNAIQRILYLAPKVHIYQIPPATSTKGYKAETWTAPNSAAREIFTARLRIVETSIPPQNPNAEQEDKVTATLLLEDPATGALFAAAPYTHPNTVEQALDSSRFFAITVVGEGRKAVLGMGFEERAEAFDFSIALQDARKMLGFDKGPGGANSKSSRGAGAKAVEEPKRDFSLKEGETISINLGGLKARRSRPESNSTSGAGQTSDQDALFSIKPPPGAGGASGPGFLPPPPSAKSVKEERRRSRQMFEQSPQDLGFDDGEFGEFQ